MNNSESILTSIKLMLGIESECKDFDDVLIMHINSVLMILNQLGVGPEEGYSISDDNDFWEDYMPSNSNLEAVKTYVYLKVKKIFDPPSSSSLIEAIDRTINELEWRINTSVDR